MNKMDNDILHDLTQVFREVFDEENIHLTSETTADDIEQWDSLTHIEMIVAVEKHFNIRFRSLDLQKLKNVGDLADMIKEKIRA